MRAIHVQENRDFHAPLYILPVIVHTEQTGRHKIGFTDRG
jgi:hypothetical protein